MSKDPVLRILPDCYWKILCDANARNTEVGYRGVLDLKTMTIIDLIMPEQECTSATVDFDPESMSVEFEKACMDEDGPQYKAQQLGRCWIHTHPKGWVCVNPTST